MKLHELAHLVQHIKQRSRRQRLGPGANVGETEVLFFLDAEAYQATRANGIQPLHKFKVNLTEPIEEYIDDKGVFRIPLTLEKL